MLQDGSRLGTVHQLKMYYLFKKSTLNRIKRHPPGPGPADWNFAIPGLTTGRRHPGAPDAARHVHSPAAGSRAATQPGSNSRPSFRGIPGRGNGSSPGAVNPNRKPRQRTRHPRLLSPRRAEFHLPGYGPARRESPHRRGLILIPLQFVCQNLPISVAR